MKIRLPVGALIAAVAFSITSPGSGQDVQPKPSNLKSRCETILKIESVLYAGTDGEKIDTVAVCTNGTLTGVHSFAPPQFGDDKPTRTIWDYSGMVGKGEFSDLKKMLRRKDIFELPRRIDAVKTKSPIDFLMTYTFVARDGMTKTITLQVPPISCSNVKPEMPRQVWDLICLFIHLQSHLKAEAVGQNACGCKSLHEMAGSASTIGL